MEMRLVDKPANAAWDCSVNDMVVGVNVPSAMVVDVQLSMLLWLERWHSIEDANTLSVVPYIYLGG